MASREKHSRLTLCKRTPYRGANGDYPSSFDPQGAAMPTKSFISVPQSLTSC